MSEVARTFTVSVIGNSGETFEAAGSLHWTPRDPAAVTLRLTEPDSDTTVEWLLDRATLVVALLPMNEDLCVGLMDVKVRVKGKTLGIKLSSPEGKARIFAQRAVFDDVLAKAAAILPSHSPREDAAIVEHLDAEHRELLAAGGAA